MTVAITARKDAKMAGPRPKYEGRDTTGATGPLAGISPLRRQGGPQYKPAQRPKYEG